ncbi:integrator complex subunit 3 homolog [Macadamia integrifolia]|uniref:integrator complex subunit 3 homolog n=1 Tax=Macadamia integrifolia TaxID=60698 RepID=UPI001C4FAD2B|nr:integrator complex subunit 3 homolog [Macadamia integrifolia]XP_042501502.1 integrator complex subunit 3 homolog [Macadamia integrifolia]XP_042501503.1 integrator complex subunit 3 homolog [Macadamia integrifolia]XP_042501504.1 integrator complex subunit 3 homolog [Macadamia integrifolia]XP_042501505.1 integrator complex subunit 3 homolog [Macadamia integrifolia]
MASELFRIAPHEAESPTEVSLREAFVLLQNQLKPPLPLTIPSPPEYLELNRAILFGVLVEPHLAKTHFIHLNAIVTDGYEFFVSLLLKIVIESYPKILESVRAQLIWVSSELVDVSAIGVDNLLISLMRQIVGGDYSNWNLWLCMELLKTLLAKWDWLLEEPFVLTSALFTYLRLLADHHRLYGSTQLDALKQMEIDFCIRVLKEQFSLCLRIGRDLVRLLQDLVHIPEFKAIWKDLLLNPGKFKAPGFSDISQLYHSRTSSRYLLLRITPEMENQLRFLLTYVKWGRQKRYQLWFARKFLGGPERETVICDLVRFICCAHHPPNEILQSDIVPRWAIIGWLLTYCRKNHVQANAKLALLYDWLFYDDKIDNIMNIEPAILLMVNSIPQYIDITSNLLEFLFLLMDNYDVERKDVISQGVSAAFGNLVRKGVVHSLDALTSCNELSSLLKERLANIFPHLKSGVSRAHPICVPRVSLPPFNLPSPSSTERRTSVLRERKTLLCDGENGFDDKVSKAHPICVPRGSLPPLNLPSPSSMERKTSVSREQRTSLCNRENGFVDKVSKAHPICVPRGSLPPLNLPSPSSTKRHTSVLREQRTVLCDRENGFDDKVSKAHPICVPRASLPPLNLPSPSSPERQTSVLREQRTPLCGRENGFDDKVVSASDNPVTSCSEVIAVNGEQFDVIGNLIKKYQESIKQSNEMGLQTLKEIILSFASPVSHTLDTAAVDDSDPRVEVLACQIAESFKLNGYSMFSSLEANHDDEVLSATALITRAFIFSQNERMQKMFLFWSKNGCPVGARLLCYASRLAHEAELMGCLRNDMDENSYPKLSYSDMSLLKCHINGFLTFMSGRTEDSLDVNQVDGNLVAKLVEGAFAAYRRFLVLLSDTLSKEADASVAKLLFSDLVTSCGWGMKRLKLLFCSVFSHLSNLSVGDENIISLLVDRLSDTDLVSVQFEIGLKKFCIFGEDTENILHLIKISINWGFVEQQKFWGLMRSELAVSKVQVDRLVRDFFCLGVLDPNVHSIAVGGLLMLSSCCAPTPELVGAVMSLADDPFLDFSATILASWSVSNAQMLFNSFAKYLEKINKKNGHSISSISGGIRVNHSTILKFLNFLNKQGLESINHLNNSPVNIPEIKAKLSEVAAAHNNR